jgi:hypothetical protein
MRGAGGRRIDAFVLRDNSARAFYEHLGFRARDEWSLYRLDAAELLLVADSPSRTTEVSVMGREDIHFNQDHARRN